MGWCVKIPELLPLVEWLLHHQISKALLFATPMWWSSTPRSLVVPWVPPLCRACSAVGVKQCFTFWLMDLSFLETICVNTRKHSCSSISKIEYRPLNFVPCVNQLKQSCIYDWHLMISMFKVAVWLSVALGGFFGSSSLPWPLIWLGHGKRRNPFE